jgi:GWxTD domain-containing protein
LKVSGDKLQKLVFILLLAGCQTTKSPYTTRPSKSLINPDSDGVEVNALVYHSSDSTSILFVEVINENLVYKRPDTSAAFYAEVKVSVKMYTEESSKKLVDSSSIYIRDRAEESVGIKSLKTMFSLKAANGYNYLVEIQALDRNKKVTYLKTVNLYKRSKFGDQNFLVNKKNDIVFNHRFMKDDEIEVQLRDQTKSKVRVDYFYGDFPPALPPFSMKSSDEIKYKPDSVFYVSVNNATFQVTAPPEGFYHIRMDENVPEGLTLFSFGKTFPNISNNDEMIRCTRYLMNKEEYDKCLDAKDQKAEIDHFWLTIGGSNERAREILKRYYGRVKEANKYYTSYTPGWKTDRGMIFIVFGQPTYIYRNSKSETWVYGMETNPNTVRYTFIKTKNPFSDNDFILERSQFFKDQWYNAVDIWRQGHVYIYQDR